MYFQSLYRIKIFLFNYRSLYNNQNNVRHVYVCSLPHNLSFYILIYFAIKLEHIFLKAFSLLYKHIKVQFLIVMVKVTK